MNLSVLIGRLGEDANFKEFENGSGVANLSLATNESYTDRTGERKESTEWHRVVIWGKAASFAGGLKKGQEVVVEGKSKTRSYEDVEGIKRYITEIHSSRINAIGNKVLTETETITVNEIPL